MVSQLHGVSGLRVIEAILAGERDAVKLAELCDRQILKDKRAAVITSAVIASLEGQWEAHHLFALRQLRQLRQALAGYRFYRQQMVECDREIERVLQQLQTQAKTDQGPQRPQGPQGPQPTKSKKVRHNAPEIKDLHGQLVEVCAGRDATVLPGIGPLSFLKLIGELGTDLSAWKSAKHFTSWLGLAPGRHESGKRRRPVTRRKTIGAKP